MIRKVLHFKMVMLIFAGAALSSCSQSESREAVVSVSIAPLKYFVDQLTNNSLEVNVMVPQGASHGTYSPTARQMQKLSDSGVYFQIPSLGYEQAFINRLNELNPTILHVDLGRSTQLIRGERIAHGDHFHEGGIDPHIWMSPKGMLDLLPVMRDALVEVYPQFKADIDDNYARVFAETEAIHLRMQELTRELSIRRFLIFHPALTYMARDYDLEQVSIEHEGKEPSAAQLMRIIRDARAENIPVIFIQEEYDIRNAQLVAQETGTEIIQINPLGYDWMHEMEVLAKTINQYLK